MWDPLAARVRCFSEQLGLHMYGAMVWARWQTMIAVFKAF